MKTSISALALTLVLLGGAGAAHASTDPFVAGNAAAATGDHAAAAAAFERAIAQHGWSGGALFNLGNAYASGGQRGRAILAYERAHVLAPRDPAITRNLAHVRELAGVSAPAPSRLDRALGRLTPDEWTWIALGAWMLAVIGIGAYAWSIRRPLSRALALGGGLAGILALAAAMEVATPPDLAVVVAADTARIAPFAAAEEAFRAPEGAEVRIEQRRGGFVYVREGDRTGWLPSAAVEPVLTERAPSGA